MSVGAVGYFLLPLGLAASVARSPRPLLYLTIFFAPFAATAVVNFSTFGIQPAYYLGLLLILRQAWGASGTGGLVLRRSQVATIAPFVLFLAAAVVSIALIPFYGRGIMVWRPSGQMAELILTGENFTQLLYLLFVVTLMIAVASMRLTAADIRGAVLVLLASALLVSSWGWLQVGLYQAGIPYPDSLFNNSRSFAQLYAQQTAVAGIKRMSSVAPEPSMLARFLLVPTFISYYAVFEGTGQVVHRAVALGLAVCFTLTLLATTSSTAFVGLGLGAVLFGVVALVRVRRLSREGAGRHPLGRLVLLGVVVGVVVPTLILLIARWRLGLKLAQMEEVLSILVVGKLETTSGQNRLSGAIAGLRLFVTHPLLGVGWGSNRTFDITTNVLAATGLIGAASLAWGHIAVFVRSYDLAGSLRRLGEPLLFRPVEALIIGLGAALLGKMISEPGLTAVDHWLLIGLLIATLRWSLGGVDRDRAVSAGGRPSHAPGAGVVDNATGDSAQ
jgi:hypothetical protein